MEAVISNGHGYEVVTKYTLNQLIAFYVLSEERILLREKSRAYATRIAVLANNSVFSKWIKD